MKRLLPIHGGSSTRTRHGSRDRMTCEFRCANQCDQPIPNPTDNPYFGDIAGQAVRRRTLLAGGATAALVAGIQTTWASPAAADSRDRAGRGSAGEDRIDTLDWEPVAPNTEDALVVPPGFEQDVIVAWGDPVVPGAPTFDFDDQTPDAQAMQFGYNNDYLAVLPLRGGRALLVASHEYTNDNLMHRGWESNETATPDQLRISMAAHGFSVVEIERVGRTGRWRAVTAGRRPYNRRITASSPFRVTGPAAGHDLLKTAADPTGRLVLGSLNDCAGGTTPWGTTLHGEENFHGYFGASGEVDPSYHEAFARYGLPTAAHAGRSWQRVDERFDASLHPNEPNRHGWIVELDPYDPTSAPIKRTMLGRFKHEGATTHLAKDGRVVAYMGDDQRFDYVYKFVSRDRYRRGAERRNMKLLDHGTLYAARFDGGGPGDGEYDGAGEWIPLTSDRRSFVPGMSVAEVLINTRLAADLVGPTKMDRPEDVEANPKTGTVYVVCTNNTQRTPEQVDAANPRAENRHGHVIEIDEADGDAASERFQWRLALICGDPEDPETYYGGYDKSQVSPISTPDNVAFDGSGNLWLATDGNALGTNDGMFAMPVDGPERGRLRQFLTVPIGAETCGPIVSDDQRTVYVAVQHPGEVSGATPEHPVSTWPFGDQPRPAVACVWRA